MNVADLKLVLDMGALEEIEKATGGNAFDGDFWETFSASKIVAIVAGGLRHTGKPWAERENQARTLPLSDLQAATQVIVAAVQDAMPDADQLEAAEGAS